MESKFVDEYEWKYIPAWHLVEQQLADCKGWQIYGLTDGRVLLYKVRKEYEK